jgi:hypothetical protein
MSTSIDEYNKSLLQKAQRKLEIFTDKLSKELTKQLRLKYKGKKVKCKCFDSWTDGDDYYFDQELVDIQAFESYDGDGFYIQVTFLYQGIFSDKAKNTNFYLESIEKVE